ncbi:hypothetical protein VB796_21580 [Arcicella sp. LKC2W]|uniref:hypothetical protein n=1 Tax=Arcicella sp. LKC2W TaxID=2984198 RepID=UPI002B1F7B61|nr:hypothetical protein [Arcicella sp. LKC2W]MEA5461674.1 hypothetical protein [Arcicella sp. LKC2W]
MELKQIAQNKNFYLPVDFEESKYFIFSEDITNDTFDFQKAFKNYAFKFLLIFYKNDNPVFDNNLKNQLLVKVQSGRGIFWIDFLGKSNIDLSPSMAILNKNQLVQYNNISFGKDEHILELTNSNEVGQSSKAIISFDNTNESLLFNVENDKKHRLASRTLQNEYVEFIIPLKKQKTIFNLFSKISEKCIGSICLKFINLSERIFIQPQTALLTKSNLHHFEYFERSSFAPNMTMLGIIYPVLEFDQSNDEFRSYLELFPKNDLIKTNFLDELGNNFTIKRSNSLLSKITFVNANPTTLNRRNFFFSPSDGEKLTLISKSSKKLLAGKSGTERFEDTIIKFTTIDKVKFSENNKGEVIEEAIGGSITSVAIIDGKKGYFLDAEKAPYFSNEKESKYKAIKVGDANNQVISPIIPTLEFKNKKSLSTLENLLVKRRIATYAKSDTDLTKKISPQGFLKEGNNYNFIKNDNNNPALLAKNIAAGTKTPQFKVDTKGDLAFQLSISKEDVFFVLTPKLIKNVTLDISVYFKIREFGVDLFDFVQHSELSDTHEEKILIFKFSSKKINELIEDVSLWSNFDGSNAGQSNYRNGLEDIKNSIKNNITPVPDNIKNNNNWNGVLILNVPIADNKDLPSIFNGLLASQSIKKSENPSSDLSKPLEFKTGLKFQYVAFPVNKTFVDATTSTVSIQSTSFNGLIDYDVLKEKEDLNRVTSYFNIASNEYKFILSKLKINFENSEIREFNSTALLKISKLFDDDVIIEGIKLSSDGEKIKNLIKLDGKYQKNSSNQDEFTFILSSKIKINNVSTIIKKISIEKLLFGVDVTEKNKYRFDIDADIDFNKDIIGNILSFEQLSLQNIGLNFELKPLKLPEINFDLSKLIPLPKIKFDGKGFLSSFPIKFNHFRTFQFKKEIGKEIEFKSPDFDFLKISDFNIPTIELGNLFSFVFDLDLGTLGDLALLKALKGKLLVSWSFKGGLVLGFKLDGPKTDSIHIDFGAFKFDVDNFELCKLKNDDQYFLKLINPRLTLFGTELPTNKEAKLNALIFANPLIGSKVAWLVTYMEGTNPIIEKNKLRLGVGQGIGIDNVPNNVQGAIDKVKNIFKPDIKFCDEKNIPPNIYKPERNWLIASDAILPADWPVDFKFIFNDPDLYGAFIGIKGNGDKNLFSLEILYKKVSDNLGVYSTDIQLPDSIRNIDAGGAAITIPNIGIDIFTNGDWKVDIGFPRGIDWSRSCLVQIRPFVGWGGLYLTALRTASLTLFGDRLPKDNDKYNIIQSGIALRIGIGAYINKGIFYAGASISVYGILEGAFAFDKDKSGLSKLLPEHFALQGRVGARAEVIGYIDFSIIKASVQIILQVEVGFLFMLISGKIQSVPLYIEGQVSVSIEITIACVSGFGFSYCIRVNLSFETTIRFSYTLGSSSNTTKILNERTLNESNFNKSKFVKLASPITIKLGEIPIIYVPSFTNSSEGKKLIHQFAINIFGYFNNEGKFKFSKENILKTRIIKPIFEGIIASGRKDYDSIRSVLLGGIEGSKTDINISYTPTIFVNTKITDEDFIEQTYGFGKDEFTSFSKAVINNECQTNPANCPYRVITAPITSIINVIDKKNNENFTTTSSGFTIKYSNIINGEESKIIKREGGFSDTQISAFEGQFDNYMSQAFIRDKNIKLATKDNDLREDFIIRDYFKLIGLLVLEEYYNFRVDEENKNSSNFNPQIELTKLIDGDGKWDLNENLDGIIGKLNYFYNNGLRFGAGLDSRAFYDLLLQTSKVDSLKDLSQTSKIEIINNVNFGKSIDISKEILSQNFVANGRDKINFDFNKLVAEFGEFKDEEPYELVNLRIGITNSQYKIGKNDAARMFEIPNRLRRPERPELKKGLKYTLKSIGLNDSKFETAAIISDFSSCTNVELIVKPFIEIDATQKNIIKILEFANVRIQDLELMNRIKESEGSFNSIKFYLKIQNNDNTLNLIDLDANDSKITIIKTNLSPRTFPPIVIENKIKSVQVHDLFIAKSDEPHFKTLLWEGMTTNNGGYFLKLENPIDNNVIPINSQISNQTIIISFEQKNEEFKVFNNFLKINNSGNLFSKLDAVISKECLFLDEIKYNGQQIQEYHSTIPAHCFNFHIDRVINKANEKLSTQYLPVEFSLFDDKGKEILQRDNIIPLMPQQKKEEPEKLFYKHITPITKGVNRYDAVGKRFKLKFGLRDIFGFRALNNIGEINHTHLYFDKLISLDSWPLTKFSYWLNSIDTNKQKIKWDFKASIIFEEVLDLAGIARKSDGKYTDDDFKEINRVIGEYSEKINTIKDQIDDKRVTVLVNDSGNGTIQKFLQKIITELLNGLSLIKTNKVIPKSNNQSALLEFDLKSELRQELKLEIKIERPKDYCVRTNDTDNVWDDKFIREVKSIIKLEKEPSTALLEQDIKIKSNAKYCIGIGSDGIGNKQLFLIDKTILIKAMPKSDSFLDKNGFIGIKPYSNQLWSGTYNRTITGIIDPLIESFSNIDLDSSLRIILSKVDELLSAKSISKIDLILLESLINSKMILSSEGNELDSKTEKLSEEKAINVIEFKNLLKERLSNFYDYDGIINVSMKNIIESKLGGYRFTVSADKSPTDYKIFMSKLDFIDFKNPKDFTLLFDFLGNNKISRSTFTTYDFIINPQITHIEYDIDIIKETDDIEKSNWIQLVTPFKSNMIYEVKKFPKIIREFPSKPSIIKTEIITNPLTEWSKAAGAWNLKFGIDDNNDIYQPGDKLLLSIETKSLENNLKDADVVEKRDFKAFIAYWSKQIVLTDEKGESLFNQEHFINSLKKELTLDVNNFSESNGVISKVVEKNIFEFEKQGNNRWKLVRSSSNNLKIVVDIPTQSVDIGSFVIEGANIFTNQIVAMLPKVLIRRNDNVNNSNFKYQTEEVKAPNFITVYIQHLNRINIKKGTTFDKEVFGIINKFPFKTSGKYLINIEDTLLPIIPVLQAEFNTGDIFESRDIQFKDYDTENGFPAYSLTLYNPNSGENELPVFYADCIFKSK